MNSYSEAPQINLTPDRKRLSMRHGPIDLIIEGFPEENSRPDLGIYRELINFFPSILPELSEEIFLLRKKLGTKSFCPKSEIGKRMFFAAKKFEKDHFVTPMIAVAGAISDHFLYLMKRSGIINKAYVNNGGDIAIYLGSEQKFEVGICSDIEKQNVSHIISIGRNDGIGGLATSGWKGRSHSLGIADAVTVLACDSATADAAATLIANAVNLPNENTSIERMKASDLMPDSDLGSKLVTVKVGKLSASEKLEALETGSYLANRMIEENFIHSAYLSLQGKYTLCNGRKNILIRKKNSLEGGTQNSYRGISYA